MNWLGKFILVHTAYGKTLTKIQKLDREILMSQKYHDTIADYDWIKYKGLAPGGYAVDYGFCYTLVRVLNMFQPKHILECGLGQSSRLVHQYAAHFNARAVTCEHSQEWTTFFLKEIDGRYPVNVQIVDLEDVEYHGYNTLTYKRDHELFHDQKYDLILVDGPFASPHYSRSQIIELCKSCLNDRFCIIIDDYNRKGEQETMEEVKKVLRDKDVDFCFTTYSSSKDHALICSSDLSFLTTL